MPNPSVTHGKIADSTSKAEPVLRLTQVSKQFSGSATAAVNQVSLALNCGDILGLLGSSGCGKTTLLRLIAGFEQPQTGSIELAGQYVAGDGAWQPPELRDVGMVFQDYALFPHLTVAKNVAFGLRQSGRKRFSAQRIKDLMAHAIALVGLTGLENRYPHELSGGQQQRVALARALAPQPAIVLLDEPLSNLDVQVRLRLRQEIRDILKTSQTTAIFVTHDQEEALSICDFVAVMQQGNLEQIGTPEVLYQSPTSRFVAEFVTQANFLPAHRHQDGWQTEIGCFQDNAIAQTSQTKAAVMIRQEDLQVSMDETSSVVIQDRQFLGREYRYSLITSTGQCLYARTPVSVALPIGSRVRLATAIESVQVFAAD
jgi:iron(III) transport system ATP-binding protein